jgi:type IV pilus assembly protein PilO
MANFSELSDIKQWGAMLLGAVVLSAVLFFTVFKAQAQGNAKAQQDLDAKVRENTELEAYRPKLAELDRQVANLKQQLEIERRIVPDEKQADDFIRMMTSEANKAGVELRRFTAKPVANKEYYTELPFDLELDGPYYSTLNFFDRVSKLERIVNVSNLLVASTRKPSDAKTKHTYVYAPGESVVATCTAVTFFSHDQAAVVPAKAQAKR